MIKVVCNYKNNVLISLEIIGHANTNKKGKDLVCAAISSVTMSAINCLKKFKKKEIQVDDGYIKINVLHKLNEEEKTQLDMLVSMLKYIARDYPNNVKIIKEK